MQMNSAPGAQGTTKAALPKFGQPTTLADAAVARAVEVAGQCRLRDVMLSDRTSPNRLALDRLFTVACSHGADLALKCLGRDSFTRFVIRLGITTASSMDVFEKYALMTMRERAPTTGETVVVDVSLSRIGQESLDYLYDFGMAHSVHPFPHGTATNANKGASGSHHHVSATVTPRGASSPTAPLEMSASSAAMNTRPTAATVEGMDFGGFIAALTEIVRQLLPKRALPPFSNETAHLGLIHALFVEGYGRDFTNAETSMSVDDFDLSPTICDLFAVPRYRDLLYDAFLFAREPFAFDTMTDLHRRQSYQSIALGDACVEFEGVNELFRRLQLRQALVTTEGAYRLVQRYDVGTSKQTVLIDFAGFRVFLVNLSIFIFSSTNTLPTPQAKLCYLLDEFFAPNLPHRRTLPLEDATFLDRETTLAQVKPQKASERTEVWVWGTNFHIREASTGSRCPLYVQLGDKVVIGRCTSNTLGSFAMPAMPQTDDTTIEAVVQPGPSGDEKTLTVVVKHSTVYAVSISDDRLRWTKSSDVLVTYEEEAATYDLDDTYVSLLRAVFDTYGRRGEDRETEEGNLIPGATYAFLGDWSKICQALPKIGIFDDGEVSSMIHRHVKFFEVATAHLLSSEPSLPSLDWHDFVGLVMRSAITTHGNSMQTLQVLRESFQAAPNIVRRAKGLAEGGSGAAGAGTKRAKDHRYGGGGGYTGGGGGGVPMTCANCGQDPSVKITENPFIDLQTSDEATDALARTTSVAFGRQGSEAKLPSRVIFSRALGKFMSQLPQSSAEAEAGRTGRELRPRDPERRPGSAIAADRPVLIPRSPLQQSARRLRRGEAPGKSESGRRCAAGESERQVLDSPGALATAGD
jgi:hypothetical protein